MNLNEHLERLEYKARLKKKLIFGFGLLAIIVGVIRFNNKIEREEINQNKKIETRKLLQEYQKNKDSLQREKTIAKRLKRLDSIHQLEEKERQERDKKFAKESKELDEKLQKIKLEQKLAK